jgi:hypothetical protein
MMQRVSVTRMAISCILNKELARKADVMRLAGTYETSLPSIPFPSNSAVATKPLERAKSALAWEMALNSSVSLQGVNKAREVLKGFIG